MKYLAEELLEKIEASNKDVSDLEKMIYRASREIQRFRTDHLVIAGAAEAAIGVAAISAGVHLIDPFACGNKILELIGAAFGAGVGGTAGTALSLVGGIGIAMMGTAFSIPVAALATIGASIGALSGMMTGWFGVELLTQTTSLTESLIANVSGAALVGFGCYMLFIAIKDLWTAGKEFISYLETLGIRKVTQEALS